MEAEGLDYAVVRGSKASVSLDNLFVRGMDARTRLEVGGGLMGSRSVGLGNTGRSGVGAYEECLRVILPSGKKLHGALLSDVSPL